MAKFRSQDLADLTHQLTLSPRRLRVAQLRGIETLFSLVESDRSYPFELVCFHITKFRKRGVNPSSANIPGKVLMSDLASMAEVISRKANVAASEMGETFETHEELAGRLQVSTKTVRRWRCRGLMGLRLVFADGVNRLAFCRSAVDRFIERNRALVERGAAFRQLTVEERRLIVDRARDMLAVRPLKLHAVARLIAEETGRAVETIRYTLRRHDESPDAAPLFRKGVEEERESVMWASFVRGDAPADIASAFELSEGKVLEVLRCLQVKQWQASPVMFVSNAAFERPDADAKILFAPEPVAPASRPTLVPSGAPAYLRSLYETALLSSEQEQDLFLRYNYLKFKASGSIQSLQPAKATDAQVAHVRQLIGESEVVRRRITQANLRLVVSIAKKHVGWGEDFHEIISDGNMSLIRAIEKFDVARGYKFSTYATWAITKNFARSIPEDRYHFRRYVTGQEAVLESAVDLSVSEVVGEGDRQRVRELILAGLRQLSPREREVVSEHFGLESQGVGKTLEQIGKGFNVTKERVRQIEVQAIARLRSILSPSLLDSMAT